MLALPQLKTEYTLDKFKEVQLERQTVVAQDFVHSVFSIPIKTSSPYCSYGARERSERQNPLELPATP